MGTRRQYVKRAEATVVAVRLELDTEGFTYRKWDDVQRCKAGDWIVNNGGDVYSVDAEVFARTYRPDGPERPSVYRKVVPVWAERTDEPGSIRTREGVTHYQAGAYLVYDDAAGDEGYAVEAAAFEAMYEPCTEEQQAHRLSRSQESVR